MIYVEPFRVSVRQALYKRLIREPIAKGTCRVDHVVEDTSDLLLAGLEPRKVGDDSFDGPEDDTGARLH